MPNLSKMPASFASVDDFFDFQNRFQEVATDFRTRILKQYPGIMEKLSYGIPFYRLRKNICFLNYRQNLNHADKTLDSKEYGLFLGIYYGFMMFDNHKMFERTKHSMIRYIKLEPTTNLDLIMDYIAQAAEINPQK
jgi:hypothetical protein